MSQTSVKPVRRIKKLGYTALNAVDLERTKEFYTHCCNFVVSYEDSEMVLLRCQFEHHSLALYKSDSRGLRHMAFETLDDAETEALEHQLRSMNVPVREAPPMPGRIGYAFQFQDPDGNWVEVYNTTQRMPGRVSQGVFMLNKLGHFTLLSPDFRRLLEFYRQIGFRISDLNERSVFTRCNPDHHGLAIFQGARTGLHHHAYDIVDWSQHKLVLDWMFVNGKVPEHGPLRHGPGNNICVYVRDPDDMIIEFYCEMEQIYDEEDHTDRVYPVRFANLWLRKNSPEGFHR